MRTLLSQFCEEFDSSVRPLLEPLRRTAETMAANPERDHARAVLPALLDVTDQFTVLADKVAAQQAYVLIFGPLKSGKSTLMNAMSAAYVSEVTSLPAYPCMVYVSDSEKREFTVTRYNSDQEVFHDPAALRMQVARAHTELADRIRKIEGSGTSFDPTLHFDEAIRRIDVKVPAGDLAQSGSVLVDTPGLYSRMKFGYDRMTKEFRNAAACAIFVVKTDNLFLEQVFEEFNQLLDLFSRIFLVVNLDSTKKDVMPDGTLAPSLESDDPIRVVEAFENLVMSAPLKAAADEGRLRIYPVDLMNAAAKRLAHEEQSTQEGEQVGIQSPGQVDFDLFMDDLSDYLNSTDYLVAFLGDSLRRALVLLGDTEDTCSNSAIAQLADEVGELEAAQEQNREELQALKRLEDFNWNGALASLKAELTKVGDRESRLVSETSAVAVSDALDRWFQSDASLKSLVRGELQPLIESSQRQLALAVHERLTEDVASGASGISLPHAVARDLVTLGLKFGEFGRGGLDGLDPVAGIELSGDPLPANVIPVTKTFFDWVLFRSMARRQLRLFGPTSSPALRIPRDLKAKRLGDPARRLMQSRLAEFQESRVPELLENLTLRIFNDYAAAVTGALQERFDECRARLEQESRRLEEVLKEYRKVLNHVEELGVAAARTRSSIEELAGRYREADPNLLVRPLESGEQQIPTPPQIEEAFVEDPLEDEISLGLEVELDGAEEITDI